MAIQNCKYDGTWWLADAHVRVIRDVILDKHYHCHVYRLKILLLKVAVI